MSSGPPPLFWRNWMYKWFLYATLHRDGIEALVQSLKVQLPAWGSELIRHEIASSVDFDGVLLELVVKPAKDERVFDLRFVSHLGLYGASIYKGSLSY